LFEDCPWCEIGLYFFFCSVMKLILQIWGTVLRQQGCFWCSFWNFHFVSTSQQPNLVATNLVEIKHI
jgi:hypothetical protein